MRQALLEAIRADARPLLAGLTDERVVVWGAGELGSWLMRRLGRHGVAFVDRNPTKHGAHIADRSVHPVEELEGLAWDEVWVSVLSDVEAVREELRARKLVEGRGFRVPFPSGKRLQFLDQLPRTLEFLGAFDLGGRSVLEVGFGGQLYFSLTLLHLGARRVTVTDVAAQTGALEGRRDEWLSFLEHLGRQHAGGQCRARPEALLGRLVIHSEPASASRLPFPARSFDAVVNTGVMEHVDDPERAVAEFSRILRPSGLALCAAIGIHDHRSNDPDSGYTPWSFLCYGDELWAALGDDAYHQNRWRAVDFERAFRRHGFEVLAARAVADRRLDAAQVQDFAPRFRDGYSLKQLSELDLYLAARLS